VDTISCSPPYFCVRMNSEMMRNMKWLGLLLILFVSLQTKCQEESNTTSEFRSPIGIPIYLSGTYAELRGNHFHAGLDIKTNGKSGYRIYSVADGYVARVKVQEGGYGKALYIAHPNGYTTVYAHLREFKGRIADYVKKEQYRQNQYGVDLYLSPGQIPVSKDEVVALSGNSGSSTAPHLHFEFRKTASQRTVQPLQFLDVKDDIKPTIQGLLANELSTGYYSATKKKAKVKYIRSGVYGVVGDTLFVNDPVVGLSLKAIDKQNGSNNSNGFYDLKMKVDDKLLYKYAKNEIGFDESRYINAHVDYPTKSEGGGTYVNCFRLKGNQLSIYDPAYDDGKIYLSQYNNRKVAISICDYKGNMSTISFVLSYREGAAGPADAISKSFSQSQSNSFSTDDASISIPNGALYEDVGFRYENLGKSRLTGLNSYSDLHRFHYKALPLHKNASIAIRAIDFPAELRSKALLAKLDSKGRVSALSASWNGDMLEGRTRNLGDYFITSDSVPPSASVTNRPSADNYNGRSSLTIRISDDLAGIKSYRPTVDGQWILMEYDRKNNKLTHFFDGRIAKGSHELNLTVLDYAGNEKRLSYTFTK